MAKTVTSGNRQSIPSPVQGRELFAAITSTLDVGIDVNEPGKPPRRDKEGHTKNLVQRLIQKLLQTRSFLVPVERAAIYARVSTDSQTVENQIRELKQIARRRGWEVIEVYTDAGISGAKSRAQRPGLDQMLKEASRRKFDVVMCWAIDRLGRSLIDLLSTIQHLEAVGVDLYLESIDTTTPMGRLVFQVTGAFAEFERSIIRQRIKAGLKRAVAQGQRLGRPKVDVALERKAQKELKKGVGILRVAKTLGLGTGTVQRIKQEMRAV
jgi:DNA invertase Pin-like site-specific DNA recombinase